MFKHYITTAWRNLNKFRSFSLINIGGLAIGLAAFWAIALYVRDELGYDRYLPTSNRVVRAVSYDSWDGGHLNTATSSPPFAAVLQAMMPQVESAVRIDAEGGDRITVGDKRFDVEDFLVVDSTFLRVFPYPVLYGDVHNALATPGSIVLTSSLAQKLFGSPEAAMGKTLKVGDKTNLSVSAVLADVPDNTHLHFSALRLWPREDETGSWQYFNIYTYLLLKPGVNLESAQATVDHSFDPFFLEKSGGRSKYRMELQPLTSIHLHSHLDFETGHNGDIKYVYIFIAAALLILGIAVINYMNLSTARSTLRVKEVGVRKAIGSARGPIAGLFLAESLIITLLASVFGLLLLELLLPLFNTMSGKDLSLLKMGLGKSLAMLLGFGVLVGLASGVYPAFFLSGFGILPSLKGQLGRQVGTSIVRKTLVTFQFVITIAMISASSLVYLQLRYMGNADLGFNKDQTLTFHVQSPAVRRQLEALRGKLMENTSIEAVAGASNPIGNNNIGGRNYHVEKEGVKKKRSVMGNILTVDPNFFSTLQIPLTTGRNFSPMQATDSSGAVIVNEAFVKQAGWSDPLGKMVSFFTGGQGATFDTRIIGVVKDFNIYSMKYPIAPLALYMPRDMDDVDNLYVRVARGRIPEALAYIRATYKEFDPLVTPEFHFLDQNFSRQYEMERRQGYVLLSFTTLAVILACLGLFGLVSFSASRRVKEIGIRKVLGAGSWGIVSLLAGDLLRLVLVAALIAAPIAWWGMDRWLRGFAFRIPVYWWVMAGAGLLAALIALATMVTQAYKASRANPVEAIKYE
jgi:putative ABC transport system permease protein